MLTLLSSVKHSLGKRSSSLVPLIKGHLSGRFSMDLLAPICAFAARTRNYHPL